MREKIISIFAPIFAALSGLSLMELTDGVIKIGIGILTLIYLSIKIIKIYDKQKQYQNIDRNSRSNSGDYYDKKTPTGNQANEVRNCRTRRELREKIFNKTK